MGAWDDIIFRQESTVDFLDEIDSLDPDDQVEAIGDACTLAQGLSGGDLNDDEDYAPRRSPPFGQVHPIVLATSLRSTPSFGRLSVTAMRC